MGVEMKSGNKALYVSAEDSALIQCISFIAFIMVVMIHSQALVLINKVSTFHLSLQHILFQNLTAWAVPWFFAIAGFFFSRKVLCGFEDRTIWTVKFWKKFYSGKAVSLLIPYLIWAILCAFFAMPLVAGANYFAGRELLVNTPFHAGATVWEMVDNLFGISSWKGPKLAGHFWFLRSLTILFLVAPTLVVVFRLKYLVQLLILAIAYSLYLLKFPIGFPLFWFLLGGILFPVILKNSQRIPKLATVFGWMISGYLASPFCQSFVSCVPYLNTVLMSISIICGILFFINISRKIEIKECFKPTFFYYCSHIIFTSWVMYLLLFLNKTSVVWGWLVSIIVVCGGVLGPLILYKVINLLPSRLVKVLTGGR